MATVAKPRAKARTTISEPRYQWERTSDGYAQCTITASAECSAEWVDAGHHRRVKVEISGREDDKREVRVWFFGADGTTVQQHATPWCDGSFALDGLDQDDIMRLHAALGRAIEMAKRVGLCGASSIVED